MQPSTPAPNKSAFIPLPFHVVSELTEEPTALVIYVHLLNAVTKELTEGGQRYGVVYDGEPFSYDDLAARLGVGRRKLRWGLDRLRAKRLVGAQRVQYGFRVFLFNTQKWRKENNPRVRPMSRRYEWILMSVSQNDSEPQSESSGQTAAQRQSGATKRQSAQVERQSGAVKCHSDNTPDQHNQQDSSSSERVEHTEKEQGEQSHGNPTPSRSLSEPKPHGQGEAQQLAVELARISDDVAVVFDAKRQKELARLLTVSDAETIKKRWREYWGEVAGDQFKMSHAARLFVETFEQQEGINARREQKQAETARLLSEVTEREQLKAKQEHDARERERAAEAELVEETL